MTHRLASTEQRFIPSEGIRPGRRLLPDEIRVPEGVVHAYDPGAARAVCEEDLRSLFRFEDRTWPPGMNLQACSECQAAI